MFEYYRLNNHVECREKGKSHIVYIQIKHKNIVEFNLHKENVDNLFLTTAFPLVPLFAVPPLTVQILPIADNGHFSDDDLQSPPLTQSSAKMTPVPSFPDGDNAQEPRQLQPLTAGRKYELPCRAYGSRPPAKLTWWMDGRRLDTTRETVSDSVVFYTSCYYQSDSTPYVSSEITGR